MDFKLFRGCCILCAAAVCIAADGADAGKSPAVGVVEGKVQFVQETTPKRYVGNVEAVEEVNVIPRVTGELRRICFKEGSIVRKGDLLFEIEDTTYRAAVEELRAQKEQLEAALRYASSEYDRNTRLLDSKAVSISSHDKAQMEINMAKAKIREIDAALLNAENNLSYTKIHAAISGRIGKSSAKIGNLLTPAGGSIVNITQLAPIYVRFSLSESVFRRDFGGWENLKNNAVIRLRLADGSLFPEVGKVVLMDNKVGSSTNTVTFWATFPNADRTSLLIPGGFVTVLLSTRPPQPLPAVVPSALIMEDNGYHVFVLDAQNKVRSCPVEVGDASGSLRVIRKGLSGNERIVIDGTHKIRPGDTVAPVPAENLK